MAESSAARPSHHDWDLSPAEARDLQVELATRVIREDGIVHPRTVAGVDVGFESGGSITRAAVVVLDASSLEMRQSVIHREPTRFPYVPGLLSFRELPAILGALECLDQHPDLVLCDGQGIAHPRRLGIACHLGVLTGLATIGVGKSRLVGTHDQPGPDKGDWTPLIHRDEVVGAVLRTRVGVKPIFVSIGHRVSLETAIERVLACTPKYRLPETTRLADRLASRRGR